MRAPQEAPEKVAITNELELRDIRQTTCLGRHSL